jgi:predicted alpha-1,6-mannanase (GH76 family)
VRSDLLERIGSLSAYSRPEQGRPAEFAPKYGGVGTVYNDDNLWIALGLLAATDVTHDPSQVATARQLFALVGDGWDTNPSHPCPGGVFWTRDGANRDRNTVTTANSALLALALYGRSGSSGYLAWARKAYEWTKRCLGRDDGLVNDHLDLRGTIDEHTWSYNQGAMIAAAVRLYHATGERRYLADAIRTADAALASLDDPLASGEPPFFLAIFYRDLLELRHSDRAAIQAFADEAWLKARDSRTGLFHFGGRQPTLLDQAAMVQIYAELAR